MDGVGADGDERGEDIEVELLVTGTVLVADLFEFGAEETPRVLRNSDEEGATPCAPDADMARSRCNEAALNVESNEESTVK
jgi:hypothetical protein